MEDENEKEKVRYRDLQENYDDESDFDANFEETPLEELDSDDESADIQDGYEDDFDDNFED